MTGLTLKTYSLDELRALPSETDVARVRREAVEGVEPAYDADSPDASALLRAEIAKRRRGRPSGLTKVSTTIRFDADVLAALKASGKGWQTRVNEAVRDWLRTHSAG